jgi:hypothetical protein
MSDWIKLHRKLSNNPLWTCEPFTRGQAWVDLILLANYKENFFYVRGVKVVVKRGEIGWSETSLSTRWKWSRTKLRKFLNDLEKEQQIIQQKSNVIQLITIINYDEYQNKEQQIIQQKDSRRTAEKHIQESKERKEEKKSEKKTFTPPSLEEFEKYFSENGFSTELAGRVFKGYEINAWKDSRDRQIKNWKQKCLQVWFKPENKQQNGKQSSNEIFTPKSFIS